MEPDSGRRKSAEVEVTNFGPIAKAKFDLRSLTVFVGPSNTGKSYLAILLYALHRVIGAEQNAADRRSFGSMYDLNTSSRTRSKATSESALEWAQALTEDVQQRGSPNGELPPLPSAVSSELSACLEGLADPLWREVQRCFGVGETSHLIRRGAKRAHVILRNSMIGNPCPHLRHEFKLIKGPKFTAEVPSGRSITVSRSAHYDVYRCARWLRRHSDEDDTPRRRQFAEREFFSVLALAVLPAISGLPSLPAYYLPADRAGIMHAHMALVGALVANASNAGFRRYPNTPLLNGVLADFLEQLISIDKSPRRIRPFGDGYGRTAKSEIASHSRRIEKEIIQGSVDIERSGAIDYPRFVYCPDEWDDSEKLELARASSMVSELAPVVLYLRHLVMKGNLLIIEEPESHLHPAMQLEFIRQIALLVDSGVRVILTTHSEWVIDGLANVVRNSEIPKPERGDRTAYAASLSKSDVGVWLFKSMKNREGSVVEECPLEDPGLYSPGYENVACELHNQSVNITERSGDLAQ